MKKESIRALYLFIFLFLLKVVFSFFMKGTFIVPDEPCIIQLAKHFISDFQIVMCEEVTGVKAGQPNILYSILISPFYYFGSGMAYRLVLILNSLLVSSLVFPLLELIKGVVKEGKSRYVLISVLLMIPQVFVYEKTLMTETLYLVLSVWALSYYVQYLETFLFRKLVLLLLFTVLIVFVRPFGFIFPLAVFVNELIRRRTFFLFVLLGVVGGAVYYIFSIAFPLLGEALIAKALTVLYPENWKNLLIAFVQSVNSLTISSFLLPLVFCVLFLFSPNNTWVKKVRWFFVIFISVNVFIVFQHIYGYLINGREALVITRYLNVSIFFIYLLGLMLMASGGDFFNRNNKAILFLSVVLMGFLSFLAVGGDSAQNLDQSVFYVRSWESQPPDIYLSSAFKPLVFFGLLGLLLTYSFTKKYAYYLLLLGLISVSVLGVISMRNFFPDSDTYAFFRDISPSTIVFEVDVENPKARAIWELFSHTDHRIDYVLSCSDDVNVDDFQGDYVITDVKLDLPVEGVVEGGFVYEIKNQSVDF